VQLTQAALEDYLSRVAELLERYGVALDIGPQEDLALEESPSGARSFELRGFLPDGQMPPGSTVVLREVWSRATGNRLERTGYEFELLDHERDFRRAFHLHDPEFFIGRFQVVVHEHCEQPIGTAPCDHMAGDPVRDAYQGVEVLLGVWVDPVVPDFSRFRCLG
jgi:hypothetical protein